MRINRRKLLHAGLAMTAGYISSASANEPNQPNSGTNQESSVKPSYGAGNTGLGITKQLAEFLSQISYKQLSDKTIHETKRATLDWMGCAISGAKHPTPQILISSMQEMGSAPTSTVLGQGNLRLSMLDAAVANGQMGHVLDFDDTHLGGVILHTSTATIPALLALGEHYHSSGQNFMTAIVAAFEAGIRTGQAMPSHHLGGWHLTGSLGTIASAAAAAKLRQANPQQMLHALGIACTQAAGMQQNRGSDCKSFHAGKSAYHGVLSAMLAMKGFNSSPEILEGNLGFTKIYSKTQDLSKVTADFGMPWMIDGNGYKPYACGVVLHPLIDAVIKLSKTSQINPNEVAVLEVFVHPDVIRITGVDSPGSGLMSKFSANHAAAVAYNDQAGGVLQFSNEKSKDPKIQALRKLIQVKPLPSFRLDQAMAELKTIHGKVFTAQIEHASGTVSNPMSDQDLERKFIGNTQTILGKSKTQQAIKTIWALESVKDIRNVIRIFA
jgi:2-methylcitrate dehydratase PrpD